MNNEKRLEKTPTNDKTNDDIEGPFIEELFRVGCLKDGYVPGSRIKNDLFECLCFKNNEEKEEACRFWKKLAQDLNLQIKGSFDDDFTKISFKRINEDEYLKCLESVGDKNKGEPLTPLEQRVYTALEKKFGDTWSYYLMNHVWNEMRFLQTYSLESLYLHAMIEVKCLQASEIPFFVPNSGVIGWLLDIGSINPLLHYVRCPKCHYSHGYLDYRYLNPSNQKESVCPHCGSPLIKEGEHIAPAFFRIDLQEDGIFSIKIYIPKGYLKVCGLKEEKPGEAMVHVEPKGYIHYIERSELSYGKDTLPFLFANKDFALMQAHYKPKDSYEAMMMVGLYLSGIDRVLGRYPDLKKTPVFREDIAAMLIGANVDFKEAHMVGFEVSRRDESDRDAIERVKTLVATHSELKEGWEHFEEMLPLMRNKSEAIFITRILESISHRKGNKNGNG